MLDLGLPTSYLMLEKGADAYASDETKVGHVDEVRADLTADIFDGIVVRERPLAGRRFYVEAEHVDEIFERGVLLAIDSAAAAALPDAG